MVHAEHFFEPVLYRQFVQWVEEYRSIIVEDENDPARAIVNRPERRRVAGVIVEALDIVGYRHGQAIRLDDFTLFTRETPSGAVELCHCFGPTLDLRRGA